MVCSDDSGEASVARARSVGDEVTEVTPGRSQRPSRPLKGLTFDFTPSQGEALEGFE